MVAIIKLINTYITSHSYFLIFIFLDKMLNTLKQISSTQYNIVDFSYYAVH